MGDTILLAIIIKLFGWVTPWNRIRYRRESVAAIADGRIKHAPLGIGAWRTHRVRSIFNFMALCGAPVSELDGPGQEANCRVCKRLWKKGQEKKNANSSS